LPSMILSKILYLDHDSRFQEIRRRLISWRTIFIAVRLSITSGDGCQFVRCVGGTLEEYCCPECGYKLTEDEQQAKKFLKG